MKPSGPLRRITPLRRTAFKRKGNTKADREWTRVRAAILARDGGCVARRYGLAHKCGGGLHVHHVRRRSQGGTNDRDNLLTLCAVAHQYVHEHPQESAERGLLILRGDHHDE